MYALIRNITLAAASALLIAWLSILLLDGLAALGENQGQVTLVLAFYLYCAFVLLFPSGDGLFHVISIPIMTQFLHLFQQYSFPAGANSLWRLLPFILVDIHMAAVLLSHPSALRIGEKTTLASWIGINFFFLVISPNLEGTVVGAFLIFLVTLPLYFSYLALHSSSPSFPRELEQCLFCMFVVLGLGTIGLVLFGAHYKGSDNLLVTRNISDTNVTMAYFILLWPFALLFIQRSGNWLLLTALVALFAIVIILSFSRGALFIASPYLVVTLLIGTGWKRFPRFIVVAATIYWLVKDMIPLVNAELAYSWQLRFGELQSVGALVQKLEEASGRAEIHRLAMALFLDSPLYGHGIASFEVLGPGYREAHSMYFTLLAEQGVAGSLYMYFLFLVLGYYLLTSSALRNINQTLPIGLMAYLVFVHSVGSVFVIIPAKSLTVNCIAPILLICLYHYCRNYSKPGLDGNHA